MTAVKYVRLDIDIDFEEGKLSLVVARVPNDLGWISIDVVVDDVRVEEVLKAGVLGNHTNRGQQILLDPLDDRHHSRLSKHLVGGSNRFGTLLFQEREEFRLGVGHLCKASKVI